MVHARQFFYLLKLKVKIGIIKTIFTYLYQKMVFKTSALVWLFWTWVASSLISFGTMAAIPIFRCEHTNDSRVALVCHSWPAQYLHNQRVCKNSNQPWEISKDSFHLGDGVGMWKEPGLQTLTLVLLMNLKLGMGEQWSLRVRDEYGSLVAKEVKANATCKLWL